MFEHLDENSAVPAEQVLPAEWLRETPFDSLDRTANIRVWIDTLRARGDLPDALRIVGYVVPKKYAIAWGCACLRTLSADTDEPSSTLSKAGIYLAERWLQEPTEEHRREALEFAEKDGFESAGAWISAAAGWAAGSMAPEGPEFQVVEAPRSLSGEAVVAALVAASLEATAGNDDFLTDCLQKATTAFAKQEPAS